MNTESRYVFDEETYDKEGLGRLPTRLPNIHRSVSGRLETRRRKRPIRSHNQPKAPQPRPLPRAMPHPVIDKNPAPPPTRLKLKPRKPKISKRSTAKKKATSTKKTISRASGKKPVKPAGKSASILDGTVKVGGMEIKKTHAAAGGATISGLLLLKLLF